MGIPGGFNGVFIAANLGRSSGGVYSSGGSGRPNRFKHELLLFAMAIFFFGVVVYPFFMSPDTYKSECGVVVKKYDGTVKSGKSSYSHDYYMDVKYDSGNYATETVSTNTWYKRSVGDRVCFNINDDHAFTINFIVVMCSMVASFILAVWAFWEYN